MGQYGVSSQPLDRVGILEYLGNLGILDSDSLDSQGIPDLDSLGIPDCLFLGIADIVDQPGQAQGITGHSQTQTLLAEF